MTQQQILTRHSESLRGRLKLQRLPSRALGIGKSYFVYEPPDLPEKPVLLYLFRGHEREWVNIDEDGSRTRLTTVERIDALIRRGVLPPLVVVIPGLNSTNNHVPSLGIDMVGTWPDTAKGLGTGQFWAYLSEELLPEIERRYDPAFRLAAGFSLGGFTVSLLAVGLAGYFDAVGIYDGLFMWPDQHDPREEGLDPIWCGSALFDAAFGTPRDADAMARWNPTDALLRSDAERLAALQRTSFCIRCASGDGSSGNRDRARFFSALLEDRGLRVRPGDVILHPDAAHTWRWTDRFLVRFLVGMLSDGA